MTDQRFELDTKKQRRQIETSPGGGAPGSEDGLQHVVGEDGGVLAGGDEVDEGQHDDGVKGQSGQHGHHVHAQACRDVRDVVRLHELGGDQEDDADRGVPEIGG